MERDFFLAFAVSDGVGPKRFEVLLKHFGSAQKAWAGPKDEFEKCGVKDKTFEKFDAFRKKFDLEKYLIELSKKNIWFVTQNEKEYPQGLKSLQNPPIVLFGRGDKSCLKLSKTIGVVGARKVTNYGREVTENLVGDLCSAGFTIVSGMALGVDAIAHSACLDNKGKTIAVLGNGVDLPFPRENIRLYQKIIENGTVVSEYPPGTNPSKGSFPARNRIIAALTRGVLITEAAENSGSLITAEWSIKLNKKVFSVPGPINSSMSRGSLKLLKQGAVLVQGAKDILDEFSISYSQFPNKSKKINSKHNGLSGEELKIVRLLENEPMQQDTLARKLKIPVWQISITLSELEMKGVVMSAGGIISLKN